MNISLEKIAPPVAFVLVGFALLLIGATGIVPIGNPQPTINEPILKVVILIMGVLLILIAPLFVWKEIRENQSLKRGLRNSFEKDKQNLPFGVPTVDLNGKWKIYYGSDIKKIGKRNVGSVDIIQKSNQLSMKIHLFISKDGHSTERIFENIGIIENRQAITQFKSTYPKNSFMIGTMVLCSSHDGKKIWGGATYINDNGKIILDRVIFLRD